MSDLLIEQNRLQAEAKAVLENTPVLEILSKLGTPIQTGSSVTGLMVYPDIDFTVQNDNYNIQDAIDLTSAVFEKLKVSKFQIADFGQNNNEDAGYFFGFDFIHNGTSWHIDATITRVGPITTNPPELEGWIENMDDTQRMTILKLKKELIDTGRYVGARSRPPHTFRSVHLYEGVFKGGAKTISDLEDYFIQV